MLLSPSWKKHSFSLHEGDRIVSVHQTTISEDSPPDSCSLGHASQSQPLASSYQLMVTKLTRDWRLMICRPIWSNDTWFVTWVTFYRVVYILTRTDPIWREHSWLHRRRPSRWCPSKDHLRGITSRQLLTWQRKSIPTFSRLLPINGDTVITWLATDDLNLINWHRSWDLIMTFEK